MTFSEVVGRLSKIESLAQIEAILTDTAKGVAEATMGAPAFIQSAKEDGRDCAIDQIIYEMTESFIPIVKAIPHVSTYAIAEAGSPEQFTFGIVYQAVNAVRGN
ncbi:hypothetical protein WDW37_19015 [Bdellovibrionota bacterium FG-1]